MEVWTWLLSLQGNGKRNSKRHFTLLDVEKKKQPLQRNNRHLVPFGFALLTFTEQMCAVLNYFALLLKRNKTVGYIEVPTRRTNEEKNFIRFSILKVKYLTFIDRPMMCA